MTAVAPGSASRIGNQYYKTDEEFLYACAEAMREEYKAIVDAGLILQLDDPASPRTGTWSIPSRRVEDYQKFAMVRVEALNHAIRGLPEDRIRFHLCWGSWHGPHTTDIPMRDIVEVMLTVECRRLFVRGRQCPPRARMEGVAGGQTARRQADPAGRRQPRDQRRRASRAGRRPHSALRQSRRARAGHRLHRLRARRPRPSRRSPGPSSKRWPRVRRWRANSCGAELEEPCCPAPTIS